MPLKEEVEKLGVPFYELPRKPPTTIPFVLPVSGGTPRYLVPGQFIADGKDPEKFLSILRNACSNGVKAVVCSGQGENLLVHQLYIDMSEGVARSGYTKFFTEYDWMLRRFRVPNEPSRLATEVEQANLCFFLPPTLEYPKDDPRSIFHYGNVKPFSPHEDAEGGPAGTRLPQARRRRAVVEKVEKPVRQRVEKPAPAPKPVVAAEAFGFKSLSKKLVL